MSYQVLARKWRPRLFKDVLGQDHITQTLINSIKSEKIAHAYLFTGTRGVGKTTVTRIFAKAIRCENKNLDTLEPCLTCSSCTGVDGSNSLDYIEIDGASNNSVDDIRELIENVQYLPTSGKYKVYVIDEVHMLSTSAFNALLKTLEEPPEHVIFVFATTDPQKLLGTVLSRCQRFDFKNVDLKTLSSHIAYIAKEEGVEFENDSLITELARQGKGSVRDTLSLMDQVISLSLGKKVSEDSLLLSLGLANTRSINNLLNALLMRSKPEVITSFNQILDENIGLKEFSLQLVDRVFSLLKNIDQAGNLVDESLSLEALEHVSYVEVMWVYESLMKDIEWSLSSLAPEQAVLFTLLKIVAREEILNKSSETIAVKKKANNVVEEVQSHTEVVPIATTPAPPTTTLAPEPFLEAVIEEKKVFEKSWSGFAAYLYENYKALAVNVERGNILGEQEALLGRNLKICFTAECRVFFDYVKDFENNQLLYKAYADFLEIEVSDVSIVCEMLDDEAVEKNNFESTVAIIEREQSEFDESQRQKILDNKFIQDAEGLFNSKIDKVVLNSEIDKG